MKAFIDTSSLIKKYIDEKGSDQFNVLLKQISEIILSPFCLLELNSVFQRRLKEKTLNIDQVSSILTELKRDLPYFNRIHWNDHLEQKALELIQKYQIRTLDSLQLASGCLADADVFITSDQKLYQAAKKELHNVKLIL